MTAASTLQTSGFDIPSPFAGASAVVLPEWIDHNGHMNVGYYHIAFDQAASPFIRFLGLTPEYRATHGVTAFALESHISFLREVKAGDHLRFEARLLDHDAKRFHYFQEMYHVYAGYLAATHESVSIHIDMRARRSAPMSTALQQRMAAVLAIHRALPRPPQVGSVISAHPRHTSTAGG